MYSPLLHSAVRAEPDRSVGSSGWLCKPPLSPCHLLAPTLPHLDRIVHLSEVHSLDGRNRSSLRRSCDTGVGTGAGRSLPLCCTGVRIHHGLEEIPEGRLKFLPRGQILGSDAPLLCHGMWSSFQRLLCGSFSKSHVPEVRRQSPFLVSISP